MGQPIPNPPPGFDALSIDEKVEYIESLWERVLEQSPGSIPEWWSELLRERLAAYHADPTQGRPWSEVKADLERKYLGPR
jgi:putative addiction module component (TIGR02574 family)